MNSEIKSFASRLVNSQLSKVKGSEKGFTLLELLIVVSIIAILSVALVLVLDPAETLRKSRDAQRISDMSSLKTALGIYTTSTTTPYLGSNNSNTGCRAGITSSAGKIYYSASTTVTTAIDAAVGTVTVGTSTAPALTDGTGWIPVNFDSLTGGSPISNLPVDPVNTVTAAAQSTDLIYRYACTVSPLAYEIDAVLESTTFTTGSDDKRTKDGGNSSIYYEVGTNLKVLGAGTVGASF